MATTLTKANIEVAVTGLYENALDQVNAQLPFKHLISQAWTDGNAKDKAEVMFYDERTVAASATSTLDLAAGLTDAFGNTLTFTKLKFIMIENRSTTVGDILRFQRAAANGVVLFSALSDAITIPPGGFVAWSGPSLAAVTVTAATGDILEVVETGGANTVTFRVTIIGTDT